MSSNPDGIAAMQAVLGHNVVREEQQRAAAWDRALALLAKDTCHFEHHIRDTLGYIEHHLGDFDQAVAHFNHALSLCRDQADRRTEGAILNHAGDARHDAGELAQAREAWQQALAIYDDLHHPDPGVR